MANVNSEPGIMKHLAAVNAAIETATRSGEFIAIAKRFTAARGDMNEAIVSAEGERSPRVVQVLKAAVSAGGLNAPSWGAELGSDYGTAVSAFLDSLRNVGAFDALLPSMRKVPLRTRVIITTVGATGAIVGEGSPKPISKLSLTGAQLEQVKATAILVVSEELASLAGAEATQLFGRELRSAIAAVTDTEFARLITAGITPIGSSGTTAAAARTDLAAALAAMSTDMSSSLFVLIPSATAKVLAVMGGETGAAFPAMTPSGGTICGMPAVVTDGIADGTLVVVDASAIAAGAGTVGLSQARHADVQMEDTLPDSPPTLSTVLASLWQRNLLALRAERYFGAELLRADGVAVIDGVNYAA
jgi:HK97 family phage major capsid protein